MSNMHRADAAVDDVVLRKKEQKDVELDKKILALRKKNEALIRRYQEIEEDKKRAEQEGMAVTSRRPKQDGLTITITKAHNDLKDAITQTEHYGQDSPALPMDKRVVSEKWASPCPTSPAFGIGSEEEEEEEADHMFTFRMGKRMQLAVTMDNKAKGKRIVSEKRAESFPGPGRVPELGEEDTDHLVAFRRGRRMQIAITMDNKEKAEERRTAEKRRSDSDRGPESEHSRKDGGKSVQKSPGDGSFPMTGRERSEYIRWKREREQIDLERLARHKNAKGEWRRAWDVEKSEHMFEEDFVKDGEPALDNPSNKKGGRNARKFQHRSFPADGRGGGHHGVNVSDPGPKAVPAVSSRAKGKDRLTGRARRWDAKEGEDMSFLKDDLDGQRSLGVDKRKSRGEEGVEENCTAEQEEKGKQPSLQDHGASSSQRLRREGGKVHPAHNGQKEERRGVKGCSTEVSVTSTGDSEPGPKPSKESVGEDANGKPGTADTSQEKESTGSTAPASSLPSTVPATSEETLSLPMGTNVDGAGSEKNPVSQQESSQDSSNCHGEQLDTAAGDRLDADQGQPVSRGGEEMTQSTALEGQALALKGEDAEGTEHQEPLPPGKASSDKTVVPEQDTAKSQSGEGDQPEDCKDKDTGDALN
ncbi:coiled-coil domain-containing protein 9B isoform X1 [Pipra filicauda]|uniref:Coiled-coil domain-containing protein 9B isoform X1 n=1 Tax=Pipra filicauda TaxID=649802 RepID=A0A6J2IZF3_9PASS|nr:coiled-coil domain-containing protein 9B isoform X1 [Pipra filicauda]XP_039242021.1 coiled-coil domain-containing protein 9B isoform X1 [Pipra filicauda]XP_039242022.1 coiled-coil domain-containing protein 9B isoform X1 [Pipra filicauda]